MVVLTPTRWVVFFGLARLEADKDNFENNHCWNLGLTVTAALGGQLFGVGINNCSENKRLQSIPFQFENLAFIYNYPPAASNEQRTVKLS